MDTNTNLTLRKRQNTGCESGFRPYLNKYQTEQLGDHSNEVIVKVIAPKTYGVEHILNSIGRVQ